MKNKKRGGSKAGVFIFAIIFILVLSISITSAERLPTTGGDNNNWGAILNSYLTRLAGANATELNGTMVNGTNIYPSSINTTQIVDGTITGTDISNTTNLTLGEKLTFTLGGIIDNLVDGWITVTGGLDVTKNLKVNGSATFSGGNFSVNNSDLFVNINNGRVGIGTTTPQNTLNVAGDGNFTGTIYSNNNPVLTSYTETDPLAYNGTLAYNSSLVNYYLKSNPLGYYNSSDFVISNYVPYTGATTNLNLGNNNFIVGGTATITGNLAVNTNNLFVNTANGYVGIGTTTPQNKLNIVGDINVTGNYNKGYGHVTFNDGTIATGETLTMGVPLVDDGTIVNIDSVTDTFTLKGGKTYLVAYGLYGYNFDLSSSSLTVTLTLSGSTTALGPDIIIRPSSSVNSNFPSATTILTPSSDSTYRMYIVSASGTPAVAPTNSYLTITEL